MLLYFIMESHLKDLLNEFETFFDIILKDNNKLIDIQKTIEEKGVKIVSYVKKILNYNQSVSKKRYLLDGSGRKKKTKRRRQNVKKKISKIKSKEVSSNTIMNRFISIIFVLIDKFLKKQKIFVENSNSNSNYHYDYKRPINIEILIRLLNKFRKMMRTHVNDSKKFKALLNESKKRYSNDFISKLKFNQITYGTKKPKKLL